jgi:hypothetical protein
MLRAQFQTVFGGLAHEDARGIIQTQDGDFVAVGYSSSFTPSQDIYVVKSDPCGRVVWANLYDLGGIETGYKVRELADGSLIIVGSSFRTVGCLSGNDAFLMKLDATGNVLWASLYGGTADDEGLDVIVDASDIARPTFTVAGRSNSYGAGDYDAWLFRTDDIGRLIWGRVYGNSIGDDLFRALDFSCDGNIVATGSSRSYSQAGDEDIFLLWASPVDGAFQHASVYGGGGDDGARTLLTRGHGLYVAGYTSSVGSGTEGYIMQVGCASGTLVTDRAYGGSGTLGNDQFTELKSLPNGNLILTGFLEDAPGGFGSLDVWLTELDPLLNRAWSDVYGGASIDQGWSVAVVDPTARRYRLIQAGGTYSFGFGRIDLYEILTNSIGGESCNTAEPQVQNLVPGFVRRDVHVPNAIAFAQSIVQAGMVQNNQYLILCNVCDAMQQGGDILSRAEGIERVQVAVRPVMAR